MSLKTTLQRLDALFTAYMQKNEVPGLVFGLTDRRQLLHAAAYGVKDWRTQEALTPEHVFHLASISKPFTATAVLQLVDQGRLSLGQTLVSILPHFKMKDERFRAITLRQMLNHTSGLPDVDDYEWAKAQYDVGAIGRYVRSLRNLVLRSTPGQEFFYSNLAFDILADVIATASGLTFEDYVKKHIFGPLAMQQTSFIYPEIKSELRVTPHTNENGLRVVPVYPYNRRHAGSSTLNSNVPDMARWAQAQLNEGRFADTAILSRNTHAQAWASEVAIDARQAMGLSWFLETYRGTRLVSHSGIDPGFLSYLALLPDKGLAFLLASNFDGLPLESLWGEVTDILLELPSS